MSSVVSWFRIPVTQMGRAIAFYEPVMQVSLRWKNMDCAKLVVFPHQDPVPGGTLAKFDDITPSTQGAIIYLHTDDPAITLGHVATASNQCMFDPLELGQDIGTIALFTDSEGNCVGLHQST